jgi:hypothetical protein
MRRQHLLNILLSLAAVAVARIVAAVVAQVVLELQQTSRFLPVVRLP